MNLSIGHWIKNNPCFQNNIHNAIVFFPLLSQDNADSTTSRAMGRNTWWFQRGRYGITNWTVTDQILFWEWRLFISVFMPKVTGWSTRKMTFLTTQKQLIRNIGRYLVEARLECRCMKHWVFKNNSSHSRDDCNNCNCFRPEPTYSFLTALLISLNQLWRIFMVELSALVQKLPKCLDQAAWWTLEYSFWSPWTIAWEN